MKTETAVIDWELAINNALSHGKFFKADKEYASEWQTCPCSSLEWIERDKYFAPSDRKLRMLGLDFLGAVLADKPNEARDKFEAVNARALALKNEAEAKKYRGLM